MPPQRRRSNACCKYAKRGSPPPNNLEIRLVSESWRPQTCSVGKPRLCISACACSHGGSWPSFRALVCAAAPAVNLCTRWRGRVWRGTRPHQHTRRLKTDSSARTNKSAKKHVRLIVFLLSSCRCPPPATAPHTLAHAPPPPPSPRCIFGRCCRLPCTAIIHCWKPWGCTFRRFYAFAPGIQGI